MSDDVVIQLREELKDCIKMMELLQLGRQRGGTLDKQITKAKHCLEKTVGLKPGVTARTDGVDKEKLINHLINVSDGSNHAEEAERSFAGFLAEEIEGGEFDLKPGGQS